VGVEKGRTTRRKLIEVGRFRHRMPPEMADPVILIVDGDEQDVRLGREHALREEERAYQQGDSGGEEARRLKTSDQIRRFPSFSLRPFHFRREENAGWGKALGST
jgi:hypothetical protein